MEPAGAALFVQLLLESLMLVAAGSALGWWFAGSATQALGAWSGIGIFIEPDRTVLWFTLGISAAVALLFGLAPLRAVSRIPLNLALKSAAAASYTDPSRLWGRKLAIALQKPATQQAEFAQTVTEERLLANLSVFFAGLAAFLIAIGLYGSISYSIGRRTMEIGVRMALGAQRRDVLWMVLSESLSVAAAGLAVGVPASLAVARTLRSTLYGLGSGDPLSLILALAGIAGVALAAAIFPARRAASTDPIRALRME